MLERVAENHEESIKFGYVDVHEQGLGAKRRALGLVTEILPAVAFNLFENRQLAFDES